MHTIAAIIASIAKTAGKPKVETSLLPDDMIIPARITPRGFFKSIGTTINEKTAIAIKKLAPKCPCMHQ